MSCLPVLVLGMGSALAHLLRADAEAPDEPGAFPGQARALPVRERSSSPAKSLDAQTLTPTASSSRSRRFAVARTTGGARLCVAYCTARRCRPEEPDRTGHDARLTELLHGAPKPDEVRDAARKLAAAGQYPSRRNLRNHGVKGSNARLGVLAS